MRKSGIERLKRLGISGHWQGKHHSSPFAAVWTVVGEYIYSPTIPQIHIEGRRKKLKQK
jgi:hypothetical protein